MAEDEEQRPESLLPYSDWTEEALRLVVVRALAYAARQGLPGDHHFYLTFRTDHPGTVIPPRLRAQYPQVMTIVLQHQFWDLRVDEASGLIHVGLSFGGVPATLAIPLEAVTAFADPHVRFGLQFRLPDGTETGENRDDDTQDKTDDRTRPAPRLELAAAEPDPADPAAAKQPEEEQPPQVVSLDAFRRRPPPKP